MMHATKFFHQGRLCRHNKNSLVVQNLTSVLTTKELGRRLLSIGHHLHLVTSSASVSSLPAAAWIGLSSLDNDNQTCSSILKNSTSSRGETVSVKSSSLLWKRKLTTVSALDDTHTYLNDAEKNHAEKDEKSEKSSSVRQAHYELMLKELRAYKEEYGDCLVPSSFEPNPQLARWVDTQRQQYRYLNEGLKSTLTPERIQSLQNIGFVWQVYDVQWQEKYDQLKSYKQTHGSCIIHKVPKTDVELFPLWQWVATQRVQYKLRTDGKPSHMTQERINALEELDFVWNLKEELWFVRLEELKKYKADHGDCLVPVSFESNRTLARWVDVNRCQYKLLKEGKPSFMTEKRIKYLEEIGFVWDVPEYKWEKRYEELLDFVRINGHGAIPNAKSTAGASAKSLGRWVDRQKVHYENMMNGKKSTMTSKRLDKLRNVGLCT